jgi:predicted RNase H-like nuclease (RuvC/YqgF family)
MIAMENIIIAIITGFGAIIVAVIGVQQRKNTANISKNKTSMDEEIASTDKNKIDQYRLVATLNNTVEAQQRQIEILRGIVDEQKDQLKEKDTQLEELTKRVSKLEQLTIEQALVIRGLERTKGRRAQHEDGETQAHE